MRGDGGRRPGGSATLVPLGTAAGLILLTTTVAMLGPPFAPGRARAEMSTQVILGLAALVLVVPATAWLLREGRSGSGFGLALALAAACCPLWAGWLLIPVSVVGLLWAVTPLVVPGLGAVAWSWRYGRRPWSPSAVWALSGVAALSLLVAYSPFDDPGCVRRCVDRSLPLEGFLTSEEAMVVAGLLSVAAASIAALAVLRHRTGGQPAGVTGAVAVGLCLVGAGAVTRAASWGRVGGVAWPSWAGLIAVVITASSVWAVAVRTVRTHRRMRALVIRLSRPTTSQGAFPASSNEVHFRMPLGTDWVDVAGRPVAAPRAGEADSRLGGIQFLTRAGRDLTGFADHFDAADWALLSNLREAAITRALQREVRDSQARIVAAADEERRRIERDLHDGAQQRLVAARLHLALARQPTPNRPGQIHLEQASMHLSSAIEALRSLAHGVFPRVLDSHGLLEAVEELAANCEFPASIDADAVPRVLPRGAAMAAYETVAAAIRAAGRDASTARVEAAIRSQPDSLWVRVTTSAPPANFGSELTMLADRVGAIGGETTVSELGPGTMLTVEVPCGS